MNKFCLTQQMIGRMQPRTYMNASSMARTGWLLVSGVLALFGIVSYFIHYPSFLFNIFVYLTETHFKECKFTI